MAIKNILKIIFKVVAVIEVIGVYISGVVIMMGVLTDLVNPFWGVALIISQLILLYRLISG